MGLRDWIKGKIRQKALNDIADQLDAEAAQLKSGKVGAMNPNVVKWLEGAAWAIGSAAIPVVISDLNSGQITKQTWLTALASGLGGLAAYLRRQSQPPPQPPQP